MASMKFSGLIDQNHSMRTADATSSYVKWKIVRRERDSLQRKKKIKPEIILHSTGRYHGAA